MLEKLMRLYSMSMAYDVRSPMCHLIGPPGCGKSASVEQLAELLDVQLHLINVSRLSPLEVEGLQMPQGVGEDMFLKMLPATFWTTLKEGDILLFDEFLRGFPEVYNGLLDIFTSRRVGAFRLPKVFIIGASNSNVTYDSALEDRLLHIPVADPRKSKNERKHIAKIIIDSLGLLPAMASSDEMDQLVDIEILPTYALLDSFTKKGRPPAQAEGSSVRNLIGQAQLRLISSTTLKALLDTNNMVAMRQDKPQYVLLYKPDISPFPRYEQMAERLLRTDKLTPLQSLNVEMNLQMLQMQAAMSDTSDI
jgi:SpoVK/Ycf46/Vps4 family AAA+-type ATPase